MKAERLFRVLGLVDSGLVQEAGQAPEAVRRPWRRWAALAACLALVCALGLGWRITGGFGGSSGSAAGGADSGASGSDGAAPADPGEGSGSGVNGGISFMSYAGPVLPLTVLENPDGLTAERTVTWDFAPGVNSHLETRQWGAQVTDGYVLRNSTDTDITVTALYPFAGDFDSLSAIRATAAVNGEAAETTLYAGAYSGGFRDTEGRRDPADEDAWNLYDLDSWQSYRTLLESGAYLEEALSAPAALDIPVTVYEFSDFAAPHERYQAATQAISFTMDEEATQIMSCGFNGMEWDQETGFRRYSYFVPDGKRREPETKMLIVLGEDIGDYTLAGYQDGGCDPGEEIDGVSCTVTRSETTLDAALERLCRAYAEQYAQGRAVDQENVFDVISFEMYRDAVTKFMAQYTSLSGAAKQRYADGRLDNILSETLFHDRVFYLAFPVTVPAGDSVTVDCSLWKQPSFDSACFGSEHTGLQGYDLVTRLGSALDFTRQSAALVNVEGVGLAGQNFGFDLENGVTEVELDPGQEHYYLELRPLEDG